MRQPYSVQVFLFKKTVKNSFDYLLFKRVPRPDLDLPAFWQGISGGMEQNETLEEVALREVEEETGIEITKVYKSGFVSRFPIKDSWRPGYGPTPTHIDEHVFFAEINSDPILSNEHCEYKWCTITEAKELLTYGDNYSAFESVVKALEV